MTMEAADSLRYLTGRKKYSRPQGMLWADNPGQLVLKPKADPGDPDEFVYVPQGYEIGASTTDTDLLDEFLILSDDNRSPISFNMQRIESRQRMINGRMRSYHIADKQNISVDWTLLPSRSYSSVAGFNTDSEDDSVIGKSSNYNVRTSEFTTDGGAGGVELLDWYNNHQGSFWVYLSYDNYKNFGSDDSAYNNLPYYSQIVEVFFSSFNYSVERRGGSNYDFWNISAVLEEV